MFRSLKSPLCWLCGAYAVFSLSHGLAFIQAPDGGIRSTRLEAVVLGFIAAVWIARDTKGGRTWPVDHSMLFYPFLFPAYMITTRKWKGVLWLLLVGVGYALTYIIPGLILQETF